MPARSCALVGGSAAMSFGMLTDVRPLCFKTRSIAGRASCVWRRFSGRSTIAPGGGVAAGGPERAAGVGGPADGGVAEGVDDAQRAPARVAVGEAEKRLRW